MPPRKPKNVPAPKYYDKMKELLKLYLNENGMKMTAKAKRRTGTIVLEPRTRTQYERHYTALARFCVLIGDVETLLSMDVKSPEHGLPASKT